MISDWRRRFSTDGHSNPLAPFLFVQLAGWRGPPGTSPCMIEGGDASGQVKRHGPAPSLCRNYRLPSM